MGKFSHRSNELELMDHPIEDKAEIFQNFKEIVLINTYLGGPVHSYKAIRALVQPGTALNVADIGSGAGDFLAYLHDRIPNLNLVGVDMMSEAHEYARVAFPDIDDWASLVETDFQSWFDDGHRPDVIHAALFCHHLNDDQFIEFVQRSKKQAKKAVIINDLHRHPFAYYSIKWLCAIFSKSRYTKNDAPLSVLRGFSLQELRKLLDKAGVMNYRIEWKWAFRYIIIIPGEG